MIVVIRVESCHLTKKKSTKNILDLAYPLNNVHFSCFKHINGIDLCVLWLATVVAGTESTKTLIVTSPLCNYIGASAPLTIAH